MSSLREAWLCVLQDAEGAEEIELITIERGGRGAAPVIELTNGVRITRTLPPSAAAGLAGAAGEPHGRPAAGGSDSLVT